MTTSGDRPYIILNPGQNFGRPALGRGRIQVEHVLDLLDAGEDWEDVAEDHGLTRADLLVACWFEARYGVGAHPRDEWLDWLEEWETALHQANTTDDYDQVPFPPFRRTR